jgi:N4-gp56 family major capsid protein
MYAPKGTAPVTSRSSLTAECKLTPDVVHRAATALKKAKAPKYDGKWYVAVIHPSVAYDLTSSEEWVEAHKYAAPTELFNGEIGQLRGVRFIESPEAPIVAGGASSALVYATLFFGKNAFGVVDPEGMGMEMIIKDRDETGGPLNQFSTVGYKFETGAKILYEERMVRVESGSSLSDGDAVN